MQIHVNCLKVSKIFMNLSHYYMLRKQQLAWATKYTTYNSHTHTLSPPPLVYKGYSILMALYHNITLNFSLPKSYCLLVILLQWPQAQFGQQSRTRSLRMLWPSMTRTPQIGGRSWRGPSEGRRWRKWKGIMRCWWKIWSRLRKAMFPYPITEMLQEASKVTPSQMKNKGNH